MKPVYLRMRVYDEDLAFLQKMEKDSTLAMSNVAAMLLHAAIQAVKDDGGKIVVPTKLKVDKK